MVCAPDAWHTATRIPAVARNLPHEIHITKRKPGVRLCMPSHPRRPRNSSHVARSRLQSRIGGRKKPHRLPSRFRAIRQLRHTIPRTNNNLHIRRASLLRIRPAAVPPSGRLELASRQFRQCLVHSFSAKTKPCADELPIAFLIYGAPSGITGCYLGGLLYPAHRLG